MDSSSQLACRNQVDLDAKNVNPLLNDEINKICDQKRKTCTCNALKAGNRDACGFQAAK